MCNVFKNQENIFVLIKIKTNYEIILQLTFEEFKPIFYYENIQHLTSHGKNEETDLSCQ